MPFFTRIFDEHGVKKVLDVACETEEEVGRALREFRSVLRPGSVAVVQILNYAGIAEREERLDFVRSFVREGVTVAPT